MSKILGKINKFKFGITGYKDSCMGFDIEFSLDGGNQGICVSHGACDFNRIPHTDSCAWTEQERVDASVDMLRQLSDILRDANVHTVDRLIDIPVEVTIERGVCVDWRVLTEVL